MMTNCVVEINLNWIPVKYKEVLQCFFYTILPDTALLKGFVFTHL